MPVDGNKRDVVRQRRADMQRKRALALDLRAQGMPYLSIARQLKVTEFQAEQWVRLELARSCLFVDAETQLQLDSITLDQLLQAVWPRASRGDVPSVLAALKIMERRARMLGTDAPVKLTHDFSSLTDQQIEERRREIILTLSAEGTENGEELKKHPQLRQINPQAGKGFHGQKNWKDPAKAGVQSEDGDE